MGGRKLSRLRARMRTDDEGPAGDAVDACYRVASARCGQQRLMMFTTNRPLKDGGASLHDEDLAEAMMAWAGTQPLHDWTCPAANRMRLQAGYDLAQRAPTPRANRLSWKDLQALPGHSGGLQQRLWACFSAIRPKKHEGPFQREQQFRAFCEDHETKYTYGIVLNLLAYAEDTGWNWLPTNEQPSAFLDGLSALCSPHGALQLCQGNYCSSGLGGSSAYADGDLCAPAGPGRPAIW